MDYTYSWRKKYRYVSPVVHAALLPFLVSLQTGVSDPFFLRSQINIFFLSPEPAPDRPKIGIYSGKIRNWIWIHVKKRPKTLITTLCLSEMKTEFENNFPCLLGAQMGLNHDKKQWFRSIFIESGSGYSQKSQSGSGTCSGSKLFLTSI